MTIDYNDTIVCWSEVSVLSSIRKIITLIMGVLCFCGCLPQLATPVSGSVIDGGLLLGQFTIQNGAQHKSWDLTKDQLDMLYLWLRAHQSDWHMILASPPPPLYTILIRHSDGTRTQINLYSIKESWQHAIHISVFGSDGKFIDGGEMTLPAEDISNLKEMLTDKAAAPAQ